MGGRMGGERNAYVRNRRRAGTAGSTHLFFGTGDADSAVDRLFRAVEARRFGRTICFLCGNRIDDSGRRKHRRRAEEHVIPLWLQKRLDILNSRLTLLNGTEIPYCSLTIPCCYECNHDRLGPIEHRVQTASALGAKALRALDPNDLFIWLGKIMYGLLYKERFLKLNRASRHGGAIVQRELLQQFVTLRLFLQSVRIPIVFRDFFPASIFVWDAQPPLQRKLQFDFRDSFAQLFIAIRFGSVGLVAVLQDGGALKVRMGAWYERYKRLKLHPLQFQEITARLLYQATLLNRMPKYLSHVEGDSVVFHQMPLVGLGGRSPYVDTDAEQFASVLGWCTGLPIEVLYQAPDRVITWLDDSRGRRHRMDLARHPWPFPAVELEAP